MDRSKQVDRGLCSEQTPLSYQCSDPRSLWPLATTVHACKSLYFFTVHLNETSDTYIRDSSDLQILIHFTSQSHLVARYRAYLCLFLTSTVYIIASVSVGDYRADRRVLSPSRTTTHYQYKGRFILFTRIPQDVLDRLHAALDSYTPDSDNPHFWSLRGSL
ncbi:hypothetical protein FB446DRAFT_478649 [Lentinula raphanica]|nr:hypothetical protein FB446DRAFT_478649 [Lentinula raphanica]